MSSGESCVRIFSIASSDPAALTWTAFSQRTSSPASASARDRSERKPATPASVEIGRRSFSLTRNAADPFPAAAFPEADSRVRSRRANLRSLGGVGGIDVSQRDARRPRRGPRPIPGQQAEAPYRLQLHKAPPRESELFKPAFGSLWAKQTLIGECERSRTR